MRRSLTKCLDPYFKVIRGSERTRTAGIGMPHKRNGFQTNDLIVYPTHGVGQIISIEESEVAEAKLELFVIDFAEDRMTVRVPTAKSDRVGMRKLSKANVVRNAFAILKGAVQVERNIVWSRRTLAYEEKIKSGDLVSIAEVVRDLHRPQGRSAKQPYIERELYELALDRMAREIAAIQKLDRQGAIRKIEEILLSRTEHPAAA